MKILDKIKEVQKSKIPEKKKVLSVLEKFKQNFDKIENMITEIKNSNTNSLPKTKKLSNDKTIRELEKLLAKQEKEFLKVVNKLQLDLDKENMILPTKKNMKKIENKVGESGGLYIFNYSKPISRPLSIFSKENPLDVHPLVVFISNVGLGSDGSVHFVGVNIHHIPAQYRKLFWNWILREYLIAGKNNRRKLEIPENLYYILKDNPTLRIYLTGYRRYSYAQVTNMKKIPLKEFDNIFNQKYKARFKIWNDNKNKFVQRPK